MKNKNQNHKIIKTIKYGTEMCGFCDTTGIFRLVRTAVRQNLRIFVLR